MTAPKPGNDHLLAVARECAGRAGDALLAGWRQRDQIEIAPKGAGDLVTSVDLAAEAAALAVIHAQCPRHGVLAEESGRDSADSEFLWIIDPLDGSVNFAHGLPHFAVSVACLHRGVPVAAVIVDPLRSEWFSATRGGGAWCDGKRLRASRCATVDRAVLATVFPKPDAPAMTAYLQSLQAGMRHARAVRRSGSMVLDLAYLAAGRLDGFWQVGMKAWDLAAGWLLVSEAGGAMHLRGGKNVLEARACVAAGPMLLDELDGMLGAFDDVS